MGAGDYGKAEWGVTGRRIVVRQGDTLFIKFYSDTTPSAFLSYAEHGRDWGRWKIAGPPVADGVGSDPRNPILLKISAIGTPQSAAVWANSPVKSGQWSAFTTPGAYDLALNESMRWTLPPITITEARKSASFWDNLTRWFRPPTQPEPDPSVQSVPDVGSSLGLLSAALATLLLLRRKRE